MTTKTTKTHEPLTDERFEALIETMLNLCCEYEMSDIVEALATHARFTSEAADADDQRKLWAKAADALDEATIPINYAEEASNVSDASGSKAVSS